MPAVQQPILAGKAFEVRLCAGLPEQQQEVGRGRRPAEAEKTRQEGRTCGRSSAGRRCDKVRLFKVHSHTGMGYTGTGSGSRTARSRLKQEESSHKWRKRKQKTQR